jgi:lysophospholipase L1-like esterase
MPHVVLIGDSIFDNAIYVPNEPCVIEQLRNNLPSGWMATLAAQDGATTQDVARQLTKLPSDATHLVLSVGGNDALMASQILREPAATVGEAMLIIGAALDEFEKNYRQMLSQLLKLKKPTVVCTVYDSVPGLELADRTALRGFNEIISRTAFAAKLPLLDLRLLCTNNRDYSARSPIEPSAHGGAKIAASIATIVTGPSFEHGSCVYG